MYDGGFALAAESVSIYLYIYIYIYVFMYVCITGVKGGQGVRFVCVAGNKVFTHGVQPWKFKNN